MDPQTISLPLYTSGLEFAELFRLPGTELNNGWFLDASISVMRAMLAADSQHLWWGVQCSGAGDNFQHHLGGHYVEGLWEYDLAELFIANPAGGYEEFNLSPTGAWWQMRFACYRERIAGFQPAELVLEGFAETSTDGWRAAIKIPLSSLWCSPSAVELRGNLCGISGVSPRRYQTLAEPRSLEPDFHQLVDGCVIVRESR